ncbi:hypothetical protein scyTo_0014325 [Scyliorhinus torazame]|uniref:Uncharacterized protein n=1 Tax=Scyliorhinus torazame TaxID=75743 RepID=A0A401NKJ9_SCYTO|nr:hypothetical protein [Scyliorhinus torazame]
MHWSESGAATTRFDFCLNRRGFLDAVNVSLTECIDSGSVAKTWEDAPYFFIIQVQEARLKADSPESRKWNLILELEMVGPHGYISATDWPLMIIFNAKEFDYDGVNVINDDTEQACHQ